MSYPDIITAVPNSPTYPTSALPSAWAWNQSFSVNAVAGWTEVDASGNYTTIPLGQSGPFVVKVDSEQILCSSLEGTTLLVFQSGNTNGRGYNSTSVVVHNVGTQGGANVTLIGTSSQAVSEGAPVSSVFGRTGAVVAGSADYLAVATGGLTGAVQATRFVGATTSGAPVAGTFAVGDFVVDRTNSVFYICSVAGTPGTWVSSASASFSASSTLTLSNKRITRRVLAYTANSATPAIDTDNYDYVDMTGQTTAITSMSSGLTGTPVNGDELQISITGSATTIAWGASFESSTVTLPTVTVLTNRLDVFFAWNPATSKWRCFEVS